MVLVADSENGHGSETANAGQLDVLPFYQSQTRIDELSTQTKLVTNMAVLISL
jgi:hypothetical protein